MKRRPAEARLASAKEVLMREAVQEIGVEGARVVGSTVDVAIALQGRVAKFHVEVLVREHRHAEAEVKAVAVVRLAVPVASLVNKIGAQVRVAHARPVGRGAAGCCQCQAGHAQRSF